VDATGGSRPLFPCPVGHRRILIHHEGRKNGEKQADKGLGLEAQRLRIKAYCELKGLDLGVHSSRNSGMAVRLATANASNMPAPGANAPGESEFRIQRPRCGW
jgi:hypothetical protein